MPKAICRICGVSETTNPDGICDDCKLSMLFNKFSFVVTETKGRVMCLIND